MNVKHITTMALGGLATMGLTGCGDGENGEPGFASRFYMDFIAPIFGEAPPQQHKQMPPLAVSVMKLQRATVPTYATWFGQLRGTQQTDIKPEVAGKIIEQCYKDGERVEKDQVLFRIEDATYKSAYNMAVANLEAAEAAVEQARVAVEQAEEDVKRYKPLAETRAVSEKIYLDAEHALKRARALLVVAEAQKKQSEAAKENAGINLERCEIRAPFAGYASTATVSIGDYVAPGAVSLTHLSAVDPIRVDFMVTGKHVLESVKNRKGEDTETKPLPFDSFDVILEDGTPYHPKNAVTKVDESGTPVTVQEDAQNVLESIDSEVKSSTGTVGFVGLIPNGENRLRSGSSVQVRAKIAEQKDVFVVPKGAILSSMNHRFIYVVGTDQQPYGIDVELGPEAMLDMPNGDGKTVKMPMQVVKARAGVNENGEARNDLVAILKDLGYDNPLDVPVIVAGGQMAQIYATANMGMKKLGIPAGYGTIDPNRTTPFVYMPPVTTTPSVTAKPSQPAPAAQN